MSKYAKTAASANSYTLIHPHGLPCLQRPDGTIWTCDPDSDPLAIGTYDKASTILTLAPDLDARLAARIAAWRAKQSPRPRTERITAYRAFMRKSKAANKQAASGAAGAGEAAATEDYQDEE